MYRSGQSRQSCIENLGGQSVHPSVVAWHRGDLISWGDEWSFTHKEYRRAQAAAKCQATEAGSILLRGNIRIMESLFRSLRKRGCPQASGTVIVLPSVRSTTRASSLKLTLCATPALTSVPEVLMPSSIGRPRSPLPVSRSFQFPPDRSPGYSPNAPVPAKISP